MYKRLLPLTAVFLLLILSATSCIDRDLCYYRDHAHTGLVKPVFNWKTSEWGTNDIPVDGFRFLFVGEGNAYQFDTVGVYKLLTGNYNAIVFNYDVKASFRDAADINQVEAYTDVLGGMTSEPGVIFRDLASATVSADDTTVMMLEPVAVVKGINLTVKVEGLDKPSHISGINCFLGGAATAVNLSTHTRNKIPAIIPFSTRRVSAGATDFAARITTFGPAAAEGNTLSLDLNLYTGGTITFPFDLSDYFKRADEDHMDVINCILTVRIKKLGISTGDTEGDVIIDQWEPGIWDSLIK